MNHETYPHYWINHLGFVIRKQLTQDFVRHGHAVTAEEWAVLLLLKGQDGLTPTQLSDQTMRDKTTITRLIDKMVAKHLVTRSPDAQDRRVQRLHLTAQGQTKFGELAQLAQALIAHSVTAIAPGDLDTTVRTLSRMAENLKSNPKRESQDGLQL